MLEANGLTVQLPACYKELELTFRKVPATKFRLTHEVAPYVFAKIFNLHMKGMWTSTEIVSSQHCRILINQPSRSR